MKLKNFLVANPPYLFALLFPICVLVFTWVIGSLSNYKQIAGAEGMPTSGGDFAVGYISIFLGYLVCSILLVWFSKSNISAFFLFTFLCILAYIGTLMVVGFLGSFLIGLFNVLFRGYRAF